MHLVDRLVEGGQRRVFGEVGAEEVVAKQGQIIELLAPDAVRGPVHRVARPRHHGLVDHGPQRHGLQRNDPAELRQEISAQALLPAAGGKRCLEQVGQLGEVVVLAQQHAGHLHPGCGQALPGGHALVVVVQVVGDLFDSVFHPRNRAEKLLLPLRKQLERQAVERVDVHLRLRHRARQMHAAQA